MVSADAKVPGAESEVGVTPENVLKAFGDLVFARRSGWDRFEVGRSILIEFFADESTERLKEFADLVQSRRVELDRGGRVRWIYSTLSSQMRRAAPAVFYSVREARANFADMLKRSEERDVTIIRNSKPVAVLVSYDRYEKLIDHIEDLEDQLSILTREHDTVPLNEALGELGDA